MHAAHAVGIVHRDLKPANILLQPASRRRHGGCSAWGIPKITDFGLAKQLDGERADARPATCSARRSTWRRSRPAAGSSEIGPWADIYALGAILYELLTGRPPFQGESTMDTLLQVVEHRAGAAAPAPAQACRATWKPSA